eukprot:140345_1
MAQSDDSDSEIDPVEALLTTMPVPQNYPRFTLTTADFEEAYGGKEEYDKRVDDIKMAPYISSIEEMNSWRPMFANADQITDQFLRELVVQTERLNSATFCMHLVLVGSATETNRILRNKDEEDSFLGWFGHAYQTFWTKKGAHSVKALLTIISDAYLHVRSDYSFLSVKQPLLANLLAGKIHQLPMSYRLDPAFQDKPLFIHHSRDDSLFDTLSFRNRQQIDQTTKGDIVGVARFSQSRAQLRLSV